MTKPCLWVVSELYYPDAQATSRILGTLAEGLAHDWDVRVVCGMPTMQFDPPVKAPRTEVYHNVTIRRVHSAHLDKSVLVFRIINLLAISIPVFLHLLFRLRSSDKVLVVTNPPVMPFIAASATALRGARCVVLTHDVYPDVLLPTRLLQRNDVLYRVLQYMTRNMLTRVHGIVALGRDMAELVQSYVGSRPVPIRIIPNWAETQRITPTRKAENARLLELEIQKKFVVLHAGTMGRTHGIEDVLEVVRRSRSRTDMHFLFAGVGVKRQLVEHAMRETGGNGNLSLLPFVDARDQNELLNACDVAVIAMVDGMCGISVPSRMYNTMAAGKPIIAITDARSELARVIVEEQIGWVVEPGHIDAVIEAIEEARNHPERLTVMGQRARKVAETKYTAPAAIASFDDFLREVDVR